MEKHEIEFLGVRKSARCHACHGRGRVVRLGVPDCYHGILGWSICEKCLGDLLRAIKRPGTHGHTLPYLGTRMVAG
jgi:hypothetical protein